MSEQALKTRSEILFLYEVKDANPNGDPLEENKPRVDPDTGRISVTDVRVKRTIRDYWHERLGLEILIREVTKEDGTLQEGFERAKDLADEGNVKDIAKKGHDDFRAYVLSTCIDARIFGCTLPVGKKGGDKGRTLTVTGPAQFAGFNRSLHAATIQLVQGTAAFATSKSYQRSFREDYVVPYACIAVYGVINELAAASTGMTEADRGLLLEGLWRGASDLISRSKFGHAPLLLLHLEYEEGYRLGDLAGRIALNPLEKEERQIRSCTDFELDLTGLQQGLGELHDRVKRVQFAADPRLTFTNSMSLDSLVEGKSESIPW